MPSEDWCALSSTKEAAPADAATAQLGARDATVPTAQNCWKSRLTKPSRFIDIPHVMIIKPKSVIRPTCIFFLAYSGLFMPYQHFFMFHDVTWARHSKQVSSALEKNVAPIRSRRFCVTFGILSTSLSRRSPLRLNFVDVAMARQSKRAFSALENNVASIRSRRNFSQRSPAMRPICSKQILICHKP